MLSSTEAYGLTFQFPARDTAVGASLRDSGEFARPELDLLLEYADAETGTFVDVGANVGALSLPFAKARPAWRVISVEAYFAMAELVRDGAAANGLTNVEVLSVAAGEEAGVADFPAAELTHGGNFGTIGFRTAELPTRKVGVRPLDDIAPDDTRVVKVDVEGFEPQVMRGAARLLRDVRPAWIIEAHAANLAETQEVAALLRAADYRLFWFFSPFATPSAPKGPPENPWQGDLGIFALPEGRDLRWRLMPVTDLADPPRNPFAYPYLERYGY